jgi:putative Holliday junction resolvase
VNMRILGLDIGDKRIGVALSDPQGMLAGALTTIERRDSAADIQAILNLVEKHGVERIVIGLPRSLNGSIGQQAEKVQAFSEMLGQKVDVPVESWDERLSTVAAERLLIEVGAKRAKRKKHRDAIAASFILQGYLDRLRSR